MKKLSAILLITLIMFCLLLAGCDTIEYETFDLTLDIDTYLEQQNTWSKESTSTEWTGFVLIIKLNKLKAKEVKFVVNLYDEKNALISQQTRTLSEFIWVPDIAINEYHHTFTLTEFPTVKRALIITMIATVHQPKTNSSTGIPIN